MFKTTGFFGIILALCTKFILATEITNCSVHKNLTFNDLCEGENPITFCLNDSDNKIYGINESSLCTPAIPDSTYVFLVANDNSIKVTSTTSITDATSLVMYQCHTNSEETQICLKTSGYTLVNSKYYSIPLEEENQSEEIVVDNLNTECFDYNNYISFYGSIIKRANAIVVCLNNRILEFPSTKIENKYYYIYNVDPYFVTGLFKNINKSKKYLSGLVVQPIYQDEIKGTPTMIAYNRFYNETNVCYNENNGEIINRRIYLCDSNAYCEYIYCTNGICKKSESTNPRIYEGKCNPNDEDNYQFCDDGYYLLKHDNYYNYFLATAIDDVGNLYYCKNHICSSANFVGYFKNADRDNNNNVPLIRCGRFYINTSTVFNGCRAVPNPVADKTECTNYLDLINVTEGEKGQQTTVVSVCLSNSGNTNVSPMTSETPLFSLVGDNKSNSQNKQVYIVDNYSFHITDGNFLIDEDNNQIIFERNNKGNLYICEDNNCRKENYFGFMYNKVYDFYTKTSPYIQCKIENSYKCELIDVTKTSCSSIENESVAKDGELFKTTETIDNEEITSFNICLDTTVEPAVSMKLENKYDFDIDILNVIYLMVSTNTQNIFGNKKNKYVNIEVKNKDIRLIQHTQELYKLTDGNYMIYKAYRFQNQDFCVDQNKIVEFVLQCPFCDDYDPNISYYNKITDNSITSEPQS